MTKQVGRYARTMNKAQQQAVLRLWQRDQSGRRLFWSFARLRRRFRYSTMMGCWLGNVDGITIGIEEDGYTHT